ncbi:hypothetical protein JL720_5302 [Aureococcus anophagefferens]|nr:hypothetical protein JL720_5302 [Aureococcus anophagefferens]
MAARPLMGLAKPSFRGRPAAEDQVKPRRVGTLQCAVVGLLGFQVVSMGLHARSHDRRASAAARPPPPPVAPRPPPGSLRLSDAEARLAALPTEPERAPWGKHNPLAYRNLGHVVDSLDHFNLTEILPVAVVKDPITWMRSMCRIAYAAHFRKHPACCPSPLDPAQLGELLGHNRSKVTVKFRKEHPEEVYASLLDLWNVWYREYYDATLPRLIVRYEDLLFDPQNTIREVCACAGGRLKKDFDMVGDAAKFGGGHGGGEGTSRGSALKRASETTRYHLVSAHDVAYYGANVDGALAPFHYAADEHRRAATPPTPSALTCATLGKRRLNGART